MNGLDQAKEVKASVWIVDEKKGEGNPEKKLIDHKRNNDSTDKVE